MGMVLGRLPGRLDHGRRRREDDVDIHAHQFGRESRELLDRIRPAKFNDEVLALDPSEIAQARPLCLHPARSGGSGPEIEITDVNDFCRLLRARRERPHRQAAEQRDELAPPQAPLSSRITPYHITV